MSNLLEKSLLVGFGIFTLIIFASVIFPFINQITEYNEDRREALEEYLEFIDEIDDSIKYVINNPSQVYIKNIFYPDKIDIKIQESSIEYTYHLGETINSKTEEYYAHFFECEYINNPPGIYELNVSYQSSLIKIIIELQ